MTLTLSVIVPVKDRQADLDRLMASVPDRKDIEVVVVDDRSTVFPTVSRAFIHTRVSVHSSAQPTAGGARNTGLTLMRGDWVVFADSDDLFLTDAFVAAWEAVAEQHGEAEDKKADGLADVFVAPPVSWHVEGYPGRRHKPYVKLIEAARVDGNTDTLVQFGPPWSKFYRRAFLDDNRLVFGETRVANDVLFTAWCWAAAPEVRLLDAPFYQVTEGNDALTSDHGGSAIVSRITTMVAVNFVLREHDMAAYQTPGFLHLRRLVKKPRAFALGLWRVWKGGSSVLPHSRWGWRFFVLDRFRKVS